MPLNKPDRGHGRHARQAAGYWLVASDGGIFAFGNAQFYGSMGGQPLNQPIVGMAATPDGGGLLAGRLRRRDLRLRQRPVLRLDRRITLNEPIVGMTPTADGQGYWFTASDGGVFAYGDAPFDGSLGGVPQSRPIVAMASDSLGNGYWFTNSNGAVSAFGTATYWGSAPQVLNRPVVGMTEADATGHFSVSTYPERRLRLRRLQVPVRQPPAAAPHHRRGAGERLPLRGRQPLPGDRGLVGGGRPQPLHLPRLRHAQHRRPTPPATLQASPTPATTASTPPSTPSTRPRQPGSTPRSPGGSTSRHRARSWSSTPAANASLVQGAIDGLHYAGINNVGIYASPANWNTIVGDYQPAVPYWMAYWTTTGPASCAGYANWASSELLPTGPLVLAQFSDHYNGTFDGDYAC